MRRTQRKHLPKIIQVGEIGLLEGVQPGTKTFRCGQCKIFLSPPYAGEGWHMSISHPKRYPTWDEITHARYTLLPEDMTFAMLLPPTEEYINYHENCFHLHEVELKND